MKKTLLALVLAIAIIGAACSSNATTISSTPTGTTTGSAATTTAALTGGLISAKPVVVKTVVVQSDTANAHSEMWLYAKIAKTTNVTMTVEKIGSSVWPERKNLMFAAKELPDLILGGFSDAEWLSFSSSNQLRPVDDLLKYMPNYNKLLSEYSAEERLRLYDVNGKMKGFLTSVGDGLMAIPGARAIINKSWLDKAGKKMPTNFNEFVDVLRAFRDLDVNGNGDPNDEIPLSGYKDYLVDAFVAMPLGIAVTWSKKADWFEKDGNIEYLYTNNLYRVYLERMNLLYAEKLLDNEYYTQNRAQMQAKGVNMQVGCCTYNAPFVLTGDTDISRYGQYTAMIPMGSEYSKAKQFYNRIGDPGLYVTSATEKNGNLEIAAKLSDFFWSEEYATYGYGPEAGSEKLGDWDGVGGIVWNKAHTSWSVDVPSKYNGVFEYVQNSVASFGAFSFDKSAYLKQWDMAKEDVELIDVFKDVWDYVVPGFPPSLTFTNAEQESITLISSELTTYVAQMEAKFVIGEEKLDDASWAAFQNRLKAMDADVMTKTYKDAYGRYLEKLKKVK